MVAYKKMINYEKLQQTLYTKQNSWLITGVAGFIGSNLLETLLKLNQKVIGLDNFSTGNKGNLDEVKNLVTPKQWESFHFLEVDIRDLQACHTACRNIDYVLHQAALGSVPRSIENPILTNSTNITGFLNMLVAARDAKVKSFTYAASSSTYGDHPSLPKIEENIGKPLSPYAVTKYVNELYADVFSRCYGMNAIGLRYFNVFGPRQNPNGAYAAVIPKWIAAMIQQENVYINGDGESSRDFCYVANAVQANLLAATAGNKKAEVFNVAFNARTSLNELFDLLRNGLKDNGITYDKPAIYRDFRTGDVRHSQADITKATRYLDYKPAFSIRDGLKQAMPWYIDYLNAIR